MTANNECDNLDAFLSEELGADAAARFEAHLSACDACRDAIDEQRWIDGLLRTSGKLQTEGVPDTVIQSFRTSIIRRRRRAKLVACSVAAAAAIIIAAGWTAMTNRQASGPAGSEVATADVPIHIDSIHPARATFVGGADMIVVPVESRHSDVTIVRVYPTYQSTYAAQANVEPAHVEDELAWPDGSNGG
jgi:anti-sigma factor RsiW